MTLLEQLIFDGTATKEFKLFKGKLAFELKTLTGGDQLSIEKDLNDVEGTPAFIMHGYSIKMLGASLVSYGKDSFKDKNIDEKVEFLLTLSTPILDGMVDMHSKFLKECKELINVEEISHLSKTPSTDID